MTRLVKPLVRPFIEFIRRETAGGKILLGSSALALLLANLDFGLASYFPAIWERELSISINDFVLTKSLLHWINDGLMTLFFLIVGLEIKREILEGELSSVRQAALPLISAVGGMVVPALLFTLLNYNQPTRDGWGIPMATDIAFALAILLMLGNRVPLSLKIFLTALAIVDDLGAVLVIAVFYTQDVQLNYLALAGLVWVVLLLLNRMRVKVLWVYLLLGVLLWYYTLQSGIHATIAGVLLAVAIPFRIRYTEAQLVQLIDERLNLIKENAHSGDTHPRYISEDLEELHEQVSSPAQRLEQTLHQPVALFIVPLFAFCNTSLMIETQVINQLFTPLGSGIILGLLVGKPLGIGLFAWLSVRLRWASLPEGVSWRQLIGTGILGGIGFTMSIFVTLLAFKAQPEFQAIAKMAVIVASVLAGIIGYLLLRRSPVNPGDG